MASKAVAPDNLTVEYEENERDSVGHGGGDHLERVDLVQVLVAEEGEHRDDEESRAGAEVADVEADRDGAEEDRQAARRGCATGRNLSAD